MAITLATNKILETLGPNGEHWIKGVWHAGDSVCLHGAIRRCQPVPGDAFLIGQVAACHGWGTAFNDRDDTDWPDILAAVDQHHEITDTEIEATFGPSWRLVVSVVRQAAVITEHQANALAAAWDAAWDAARHAARDPDRYAARHAAWYAALDAARYARDAALDAAGYAWDAARDAAGDAALAAVATDLIGQHGFTQQHWDTLTGPWVAVFGPITETSN